MRWRCSFSWISSAGLKGWHRETKETGSPALSAVFDGWEGHQISLVKAVEPLTVKQLAYRPAAGLRTVGEIVNHIAAGRGWLARIGEMSAEFTQQLASWEDDGDVNQDAAELVRRLQTSWQQVAEKLTHWSVADLSHIYPLPYGNEMYAVSRQWVLWRILAHDLHHGGELALMLGEQGISIPELGREGGHITVPPLWNEA